MRDVFQTIREGCAAAAAAARWVQIDAERLEEYAQTLELSTTPQLSHTPEHHLLGRGQDTIAFFLVLDSINFGSGYFPFLNKDPGASGYFTIARRLKEWFLAEGVPSADMLRTATVELCADVFGQDVSNPHVEELMELFASALRQLGEWTKTDGHGRLTHVFEKSSSASEVIEAITRMPFYWDAAVYRGREVLFLKRAQILVQDVAIAVPDIDGLQFRDLDRLTAFADNVLPYVLRADGVLTYLPWLLGRIQREELLGSGSPEEVEIRACTIHAVDLLSGSIARRRDITMRELDFHLWNRGQELKKRVPDRRHRTRCVFY